MRRLWIQRHKALAACGTKIKVYMEDAENGELEIRGVLCRKLGEVANGQRKMFPIGHEAVRIFVIGDKLSRNTFNEFCHIPAGTGDVFLSGRNYYQPFSGNPFRFDGNQAPDALQNRETVKKRGRKVLIASLIAGLLLGGLLGTTVGTAIGRTLGGAVADASAVPQTFRTEGLTITLSSKFSQLDMEGYAACYGAHDAAVFITREPFSMAEGAEKLTLEEYGALVLQNNARAFGVTPRLQQTDGLIWFDYDYKNPENGKNMNYFTVVYKGPDAFWMVQFVTETRKAEQYRAEFETYASSVVLTGAL